MPAKRGRATKKAAIVEEDIDEEEVEETEQVVRKVEPAKDNIISKLKAADKKDNKPKVYHADKELSASAYSV